MTRLTRARALTFAGLVALAAAMAGCVDPRNTPRTSEAQPGHVPDPARPHDTIDPRDTISNPAPSRTVQIPSIAPDPTAVAPQGVLPDPYGNPR